LKPRFKYGDIYYNMSALWRPGFDNVIAMGQTIPVMPFRFSSLNMLAATSAKLTSGFIQVNYLDGTNDTVHVQAQPWWKWPYPTGGDIIIPNRLVAGVLESNYTSIHQSTYWIDPTKIVTSLILPPLSFPSTLHIFALSLMVYTEAPIEKVLLRVESARALETWPEGLNARTRIVRVVVTNISNNALTRNQNVRCVVHGQGLGMLKGYGYIRRLLPGQQATIDLAVLAPNRNDTQRVVNTTVLFTGDNVAGTEYEFDMTLLPADYSSDFTSIYRHESPAWFNDAKFGIFIHWGVYSVPGWGNTGKNESYAEW